MNVRALHCNQHPQYHHYPLIHHSQQQHKSHVNRGLHQTIPKIRSTHRRLPKCKVLYTNRTISRVPPHVYTIIFHRITDPVYLEGIRVGKYSNPIILGRWKHSRAILKQASQYWEEVLVGDAAGTYKGHEVYQILGQSGKVMEDALRCITEGVLPYTGQLLSGQDLGS